MRRLFRLLAQTAILLVLFILLLPGFLYLYWLRALPENSSPTATRYPPYVYKAVLASLTGNPDAVMVPVNPWSAILNINDSVRSSATSLSLSIATVDARILLARSTTTPLKTLSRHAAHAAVAIWISRHWTTEEALSTYLAEAYYGHGYYGLGQAAQGYYGVTPEQLSARATLVMVTLLKAPKMYDPWCYPERTEEAVKSLIERTHLDSNALEQRPLLHGLLPPPPNGCTHR